MVFSKTIAIASLRWGDESLRFTFVWDLSLCCVLGRSDTTVTLEWNPCTAQGTVAYELQVNNAIDPLPALQSNMCTNP